MKIAYWVVFVLMLVMMGLGLWYFQIPQSSDVDVTVLEQWYKQHAAWNAVIGALVGAALGVLANRIVRPRPRESVAAMYARVGVLGLATALGAAIIGGAISAIMAYNQTSWQLSGSQRVALAASDGLGRFLAVPSAAFLAAALMFATLTRARTWPGKHSLL